MWGASVLPQEHQGLVASRVQQPTTIVLYSSERERLVVPAHKNDAYHNVIVVGSATPAGSVMQKLLMHAYACCAASSCMLC
jgi:hypothetical protein